MTAMTTQTVMMSLEALCACAVLVTLAMEWRTVQVKTPYCLWCVLVPIPIFPFPDVDECDLGSYVCDVNAYCENTIGSYDCVCVDGYVENGTFCMSKHTPQDTAWEILYHVGWGIGIRWTVCYVDRDIFADKVFRL